MSALPLARESLSLDDVFARYHVGWTTRNPDLIASLHSDDTVFWVHDGSEPVKGRDALRQHCVALFARMSFGFKEVRLLYGPDHWVFEWRAVLDLTDTAGQPFTAEVEMLDVVTVNDRGEVTRKDVFMNGGQMQAAYSRAGLSA